jgi:hypothetical protein
MHTLLYAPFALFYLLHLFDPFEHAVSHALVFCHHDKYCSTPVGFIEELMQTFHLKLPLLSMPNSHGTLLARHATLG